MTIAILACFWGSLDWKIFFNPFTLSKYLFLVSEMCFLQITNGPVLLFDPIHYSMPFD
jgi:hypothetical protein